MSTQFHYSVLMGWKHTWKSLSGSFLGVYILPPFGNICSGIISKFGLFTERFFRKLENLFHKHESLWTEIPILSKWSNFVAFITRGKRKIWTNLFLLQLQQLCSSFFFAFSFIDFNFYVYYENSPGMLQSAKVWGCTIK